MSDITFEPEDTTFDDFMNNLPDLPTGENMDQADFDALIAELVKDSPTVSDVDTTQPEIDLEEMQNWLDSLEPSTLDMDM